jgi:hypothetical protein
VSPTSGRPTNTANKRWPSLAATRRRTSSTQSLGMRSTRFLPGGVGERPGGMGVGRHCRSLRDSGLTATASKSAASLEFLPSVTTISANRFMHIRSNCSTPVLMDWLRSAFPDCRRPAHLPIGFVPHQPAPCAPSDLSMFPTRTRAFKLYCGYRGIV